MELFYFLFGAYYIYSIIHLIILQWKDYNSRTGYEKVVTWVAIGCTILTLISVLSE